MDSWDLSPSEQRAAAWRWEQNDFGLPDFLYTPLTFTIFLIVTLGVSSSVLGLLPGVNTRAATLSGVGTPWISLLALLVIAGFWSWRALSSLYATLSLALIVAAAVIVTLLANLLFLDTLLIQNPDAFIGSLGLCLFTIPLFFLMGFLFEGFMLSAYMGLFTGLLLGGLLGFPLSFGGFFIMMFIHGPLGALAGGTAGLVRPMFRNRRRRRRR